MGRSIEDALDLGPPRHRPARPCGTTTFDKDGALPGKLWYLDPVARIYHERRTNTFVVHDDAHDGWIAVSRDTAFREFRPERARLLVDGAPPEVEHVLDYILALEPNWRGL
jgi:hypothetical protein